MHLRLFAGSRLYRIFRPSDRRPRVDAFRLSGPRSRFDHHRVDGKRGILYAAPQFSTCLVEAFGDSGLVVPGEWRIGAIVATRDLVLLDLRGKGAMRAGTVAAVAKTAHRLSREWSRYFYEHEDVYGRLDGLVYAGAHNDEECIALYERARDGIEAGARSVRLNDPAIRTAVILAARENGLDVSSR